MGYCSKDQKLIADIQCPGCDTNDNLVRKEKESKKSFTRHVKIHSEIIQKRKEELRKEKQLIRKKKTHEEQQKNRKINNK